VANFSDGNVTAMAIDAGTGSLTSIAGSPFGAGTGAVSIAIDPTGTFAYVANETAATISTFSVDSANGVLTPAAGSPLTTGSSPESLAVDPEGRFLYAANVTSKNEITDYAINSTSGAITAGSPIESGTFPLSIVIDPLGQFAYVANADSSDVSVYSIDATTGVLTPVAGSPFTAEAGSRSIAID
jgi:6-phosphogluconolactonase (cycloisomerase 2 family)